MSVVKDAGIVTAYGAAVKAGYEGSYEDFCAAMADLGVQVGYLESMTVTVNILTPSSSASASYANGVLTLNIPRGNKGDKGNTGATPNLTIGTVTTGEPGSSAAATITGTAENPVLNLTIPEGEKGDTGNPGEVPAASIASSEATTTASKAYAVGEHFWLSGNLYEATAAIASGGTITVGTNCKLAKIGDEVSDLKTVINQDVAAITANMSVPESRNILDIDAITSDLIIWKNGATQSSQNFFTTDYIPVESGEKISPWYFYDSYNRYVQSDLRTVCAYDSAKNVIATSGTETQAKYYTVPNGVAFIRTSIPIGDLTKQPMITRNVLFPIKYEAFQKNYVEGNNFSSFDDSMEKVDSKNLKRYIRDNCYMANNASVPTASTSYHLVNPIEIAEGESISAWQYQNGVIAPDDWRFLAAYDEHGDLLSSYGSTGGVNVYTAPENSGVKYIYISQYKRGNPQIIVRGTKAPTFYEDYHEPYNVSTNAFEKDNTPYRVLVLGDSYTSQNLWTTAMAQQFRNMDIIRISNVGAKIKDNYADRTTYPYTSRPTGSTVSGNQNTFGSLLEKLKRLKTGTDLDSGETAIYQSEDDYPNVVIIEGGQNDNYDSDEVVATYLGQFLTLAENVYYVHDGNTTQGNYYIPSNIETIDRTCFAGAYRYIVDTIHGLFPNAQIFFTTRSRLGYFIYDVNDRTDKIAEQQRECAMLCGVSVIDWNKCGNISTITDHPTGSGTSEDPYKTQNTLDSSDGLHPNVRGGLWYGRLAAKVIKDRFADISTALN